MHRSWSGAAAVVAFHAAAALALGVPLPAGYRLDVDGKLEGWYVQRVHDSTPREDPQGRLRLRLGGDLSSRIRLETAVTGTAGGLPRDPSGPGLYDFEDVKQDLSPSLDVEEGFLDATLPSLDVRLGIQKFAWGKLDGMQPNDLLNPEKFYDPILEDEHDRKIGVPAAAATVYLPPLGGEWAPTDVRFTAVWTPVVVAFRFPDMDERWYPPLARVPSETEAESPTGPVTVENESRFVNREAPNRFNRFHGTDSGGAARLAGLFHGADFALYYFDGYDTAPSLDVDVKGFARFDPTAPSFFRARSEITIFPIFHRIRAVGADVAYNLLGATLRAEAAYVLDRLYPRSIRAIVGQEQVGQPDPVSLLSGQETEVPVTLPPVNVERDAVEWGVGGDYVWNEVFFLVQVNQTAILRNREDLLLSDTETRFATTLRRSFLDDKLQAELIGFYGMQGVYGLAHPRLTWTVVDSVDVRVGYLLIEGHTNSFVGEYARNDEGYVRVRYSF